MRSRVHSLRKKLISHLFFDPQKTKEAEQEARLKEEEAIEQERRARRLEEARRLAEEEAERLKVCK